MVSAIRMLYEAPPRIVSFAACKRRRLQFATEGAVEHSGQQRVKFRCSLGLRPLEGVHSHLHVVEVGDDAPLLMQRGHRRQEVLNFSQNDMSHHVAS